MPVDLIAATENVRRAATKPPTKEQGSQTRLGQIGQQVGLTVGLLQEQEYTTAWRWPVTWRTVDMMRSDSQIEALFTAISLSVRRRSWMLEPNDADDVMVEGIAYDLGLPVRGDVQGETRGRQRDKFSWDAHLQHALLGLLYGLYDFEIVGHIAPDGAWRLDKLAPRPPRTVMFASVDEFGELASVTQLIGHDLTPAPILPAEHLVHYCWDREGANWYGRSVLRAIYREFDIKDRLIKVDALKHQRNGMGVPIVKTLQPTVGRNAEDAALAVASALRVGEDAAAAMPYGTDLTLQGVQGTLPDTLASIKEHNEAMARRFHAMFMMLGQTHSGSRALGQTQKDFFAEVVDTYADWVADTVTQQFVERWATWNYGPDARAPRIVSERDQTDTTEMAVTDMLQAVQVGALTPDAGVEDWLRDRYGLPEKGDPEDPAAAPAGPPRLVPAPAARRPGSPAAASGEPTTVDGVKIPARTLRRTVKPFEALAAVDFQAIDAIFEHGIDRLVAEWASVKTGQITDLHAQIAAATSEAELALVQAAPAGADVLVGEMVSAFEQGAREAASEAKSQGRELTVPEVTQDLRTRLEQRCQALATVLSRSLSQAAAAQALARSGGAMSSPVIADEVKGHLETLSDQFLRDQFTGLLSQGMNTGRRTVMATSNPDHVYASALLDANACDVCIGWDGHSWTTLEEAELQFPAGGNADCAGGPRCRCTLVATYDETAPTLQGAGA